MAYVGRYELIRRLARGGMAEVFLARAEGPGGFEKQVVVKRILPDLASDQRFVDLFLAEARISAHLNHPNIVQIFDFGEADGSYFIAMEYVDGPSLRAVIRTFRQNGWQLPMELAARIAISACEALSYAHDFVDPSTQAAGVIHRDVSPENIIVSRAGGVKLVDFGIAKAVSGAGEAMTTARRGKHSYMAPEQIRGRKGLDGRVDVFALGIVLYEMICGYTPFKRSNELATLQAILFEEAEPLAKHRPGVPESLQAVVSTALQKDRDLRFPGAREMLVKLERFLVDDCARSVTGVELSALARKVADAPAPEQKAGADGTNTALTQSEAVTEPGEPPMRRTVPLKPAPVSQLQTVIRPTNERRRASVPEQPAAPPPPPPEAFTPSVTPEPLTAGPTRIKRADRQIPRWAAWTMAISAVVVITVAALALLAT